MHSNSKEPVTRRSYPWVEGLIIPVYARDAIISQAGGPTMTIVCEMSEQKQKKGWPKFSLAHIDVGIGLIICQDTAENISSHVVRYMPIDAREQSNE
ncbi:hypothetical protein DVH07_06300 [Hafnia paralvei]|uniref:hypothetical protein n=1 Tax=Hafnia paralvei TaxID=546367 RepID=UPI000DF2EFC7|nr:hypothetical protein [Hafnia paralvei]RDA68307.1 hypothetical protein DU449_07610 [Hafnia paralvei]RDA69346.1 hypothetical protein DVH09_08205 [Hafnia paralvei]RDA69507.1 hypothetical protein DVH08_09200 [Hafnia paralvei]RDA79550.1 hypothetical protein DVH10_06590 [Hafnia paralvei]RDA80087.1 hypothetical protein DVH07_06300 [Hafnia paralvei]